MSVAGIVLRGYGKGIRSIVARGYIADFVPDFYTDEDPDEGTDFYTDENPVEATNFYADKDPVEADDFYEDETPDEIAEDATDGGL